MGHRSIEPAYPAVRRVDFVPHSPFLSDRFSGTLEVEWSIDRARPVVIGAGWLVPVGGEAVRSHQSNDLPRRHGHLRAETVEVVAEIARRGAAGTPVLPGTSLKGAVRQVYELLTPSCRLVGGRTCKADAKDPAPRVCPACSLFGIGGLGGRLAVGEAVPVAGQARALKIAAPAGWKPPDAVPGTLRVYGSGKARDREGKPATTGESTFSVVGRFTSRLRLVNASDDELGLLFASLGLGAPSPMLRVGGKKYHGLGTVDVAVSWAQRIYPRGEMLKGEPLASWVQGLMKAAVGQVEPRRLAWEALHAALRAD
jgi:hypothetical protein